MPNTRCLLSLHRAAPNLSCFRERLLAAQIAIALRAAPSHYLGQRRGRGLRRAMGVDPRPAPAADCANAKICDPCCVRGMQSRDDSMNTQRAVLVVIISRGPKSLLFRERLVAALIAIALRAAPSHCPGQGRGRGLGRAMGVDPRPAPAADCANETIRDLCCVRGMQTRDDTP